MQGIPNIVDIRITMLFAPLALCPSDTLLGAVLPCPAPISGQRQHSAVFAKAKTPGGSI